jgi:hypothetical protein
VLTGSAVVLLTLFAGAAARRHRRRRAAPCELLVAVAARMRAARGCADIARARQRRGDPGRPWRVTSPKLDRSFVGSITTVTRQAAVATAVIQIAQALDLDVVAEGIETPEQAALLRRLGYRRAQGFLYHRPQPPEKLAGLWASASASGDLGRLLLLEQ